MDLLTHGDTTGERVAMPDLAWHAQTVAHCNYLLEDARDAALLAGTHCVPLRVPAPERFMWHKFYSGLVRRSFPEKAAKDLRQAALLAAVLAREDEEVALDAAGSMPAGMRRALKGQRQKLLAAVEQAPAAQSLIERALLAR